MIFLKMAKYLDVRSMSLLRMNFFTQSKISIAQVISISIHFFFTRKKKSRLIFSIRLIFKVTIVESTLMKLLLFLILPSLRLVSNF